MVASHRRNERPWTFRTVGYGRHPPRPRGEPDESVYAPYDDWETADYEAFSLSGPRVEYVVYDLRALAEQTDENPKRSDGLIRYDTKYALAGFDYLTFVE